MKDAHTAASVHQPRPLLGQRPKAHVAVFEHGPEMAPIQSGMLVDGVQPFVAFQVRE
jgi:hypothetical protein